MSVTAVDGGTGGPHGGPHGAAARAGRPPATSAHELERVCLELFDANGFEATSVDDIAVAAGIGRRTFFRYFPSKNDAVWGDFAASLDAFRAWFAATPRDEPAMSAVRRGVVAFNTYDAATLPLHRRRMALILGTPALQAHSTLRFRDWRAVVAAFVADRTGGRPDDLLPRAVGHLSLAAALAAYEQWLADPDGDLLDHLAVTLDVLDERALAGPAPARRARRRDPG